MHAEMIRNFSPVSFGRSRGDLRPLHEVLLWSLISAGRKGGLISYFNGMILKTLV